MLAQLYWGLEGITEVDTDPKVRFVSLKVTPLITESSIFVPLQGITSESSWLEDVSLKDYKIIWKINVRELKTKLYLETSLLLRIKWIGMVEIKHKDFTDDVLKVKDMQGLH